MTTLMTHLHSVVGDATVALAVVDLDGGRLVEASARFRDLAGIGTGDSLTAAIAGIGARERLSASLGEIRDGHRASWAGPAAVTRRGRLLPTRISVTAAARSRGRQEAAIVSIHLDADQPAAAPLAATKPVVVIADHHLNIERITTTDAADVATTSERFVATSLLDHVHPDDAPAFARDCLHARHSNSVVRASVLMLPRSGIWEGIDIAIHPLAHPPTHPTSSTFALVLRAPRCDHEAGTRGDRTVPAGTGPVGHTEPGLVGLTPREREVALRLADAQRVTSIAKDLVVSPSTVRNHLSAVFRKVGVRSQAELVDLLRAARAERPSGLERSTSRIECSTA